jgi:chromosome segregation ATPase
VTHLRCGAGMRPFAILALVTLLVAGCAAWMPFGASHELRERADRLALEGRYSDAVQAYDAFLAQYPDDRAASRVRVSRGAAAGVLATRTEAERLGREVAMLRGTLQETIATRDREQAHARDAAADATAEVARLKAELAAKQTELAARQAEVTRLNAELERLRADLEELKRVDLRAPKH